MVCRGVVVPGASSLVVWPGNSDTRPAAGECDQGRHFRYKKQMKHEINTWFEGNIKPAHSLSWIPPKWRHLSRNTWTNTLFTSAVRNCSSVWYKAWLVSRLVAGKTSHVLLLISVYKMIFITCDGKRDGKQWRVCEAQRGGDFPSILQERLKSVCRTRRHCIPSSWKEHH